MSVAPAVPSWVLLAAGLAGVCVLVGRGGAGMTKMLHALCECLLARDIRVRFLERDPAG